MKRISSALVLVGFVAATAAATPVNVSVVGEVEYNQVTVGPFANSIVHAGDAATISFQVDSNDFINGSFPTRGYVIDQASFEVHLGSASGGLQSPFSGTPYFVLRDNDPAVVGFLPSVGPDFPTGITLNGPANVAGTRFFTSKFTVSYTGTTLPSLDILDAIGVYDFTGLGSFYYTMSDLGFDAIGLIFAQMTISAPVAVEPTTWGSVKALYR